MSYNAKLMFMMKIPYLCSLTFGYREGGWPLGAQNVQTDASITVDIWVVDFCCEGNLSAT